jgi:hypothetical protein
LLNDPKNGNIEGKAWRIANLRKKNFPREISKSCDITTLVLTEVGDGASFPLHRCERLNRDHSESLHQHHFLVV